MKKMLILSLFLLFSTTVSAKNSEILVIVKQLNLSPGSKASIQWERVFSSQRHLEKYKLDRLSQNDRNILKSYLIKHSADSDQPIVPGL